MPSEVFCSNHFIRVVPEGEKHWGGQYTAVVIGGDNLPTPGRIGLTDLQNIGGGGQWPPGSGTAVIMYLIFSIKCFTLVIKRPKNELMH